MQGGCQPYVPASLYHQEDSWYSFLLEAETSQGHSAARRFRPIEKSSDLIANPTRDPPVCSVMLQPTTLTCADDDLEGIRNVGVLFERGFSSHLFARTVDCDVKPQSV
jgi:hypothetical protein